MNNKIVISVTAPNVLGGIASYFYTIKKYFKTNVKYVIRGPRDSFKKYSKISEIYRIILDILIFLFEVARPSVKVVHLNTSLGKRGVPRDLIFIYLAKLLHKSTIVFFHGWNPGIEKEIDDGKFDLFKKYISKVDVAITLSSRSKKKLREWGFKNKIYLETTIVDDTELLGWNEYDLKKRINSIDSKKNIEFLFLARMIKEKGIYEAIDTFKILSQIRPNIYFNIAGDGPELENAKKYIEQENVKNAKFYGYATGKEKIDLLKKSHILLFPSYNEGMPIAVLEAMAFGLIIVTRPVGGLIDFFTDKMGIILNTLEPKVFAKNIGILLQRDLFKISINNYRYAKEHFYASIAVKRIENIYNQLLNKNS